MRGRGGGGLDNNMATCIRLYVIAGFELAHRKRAARGEVTAAPLATRSRLVSNLAPTLSLAIGRAEQFRRHGEVFAAVARARRRIGAGRRSLLHRTTINDIGFIPACSLRCGGRLIRFEAILGDQRGTYDHRHSRRRPLLLPLESLQSSPLVP